MIIFENCFEFKTFNIFYVLGNDRKRETSTGNRLFRNYNTLLAITLSMILPHLLLHRMLPLPPPLLPALSWSICWPNWISMPSNKCLIDWINPSAGYWKVRDNWQSISHVNLSSWNKRWEDSPWAANRPCKNSFVACQQGCHLILCLWPDLLLLALTTLLSWSYAVSIGKMSLNLKSWKSCLPLVSLYCDPNPKRWTTCWIYWKNWQELGTIDDKHPILYWTVMQTSASDTCTFFQRLDYAVEKEQLKAWLATVLMPTARLFIHGKSKHVLDLMETDKLYLLWGFINSVFWDSPVQAIR